MKIKNLPEIIIPEIKTSKKLKIFYVADVCNWSFHLKGIQYKKHLPEFDIDIGFATDNWIEQCTKKNYDVVVHLHEQYIKEVKALKEFILEQNKKGTKVLLTINEVICPYDLIIKKEKLLLYNGISVNNPYMLQNLLNLGFKNIFLTYDGVDLETFFVEKEFSKRDFGVFFSSSMMRMVHKGYNILQDVKFMLKKHKDIYFKEVYSDSYNNKVTWQEMRAFYNNCKIFLCLSQSEGGPCTFLESAACGCVPVMTDVGYSNYFKSCSFISRNASSCVEKILEFKNNQDLLLSKHELLLTEVKNWDSKLFAKQWGNFWCKSYYENIGNYS